MVRNSLDNAGGSGLIPGLGRSLEEEMGTHSSNLALDWEIPWTEEPAGLQFMGPQRVDMTKKLSTYFIYSKMLLFICLVISNFSGPPWTPDFPVIHYLSEFAQTCVHWVGDAIQPSHPLLPSSLPALNLSKNQGFFPMSWLFTSGG